jgi:hypothetical protein
LLLFHKIHIVVPNRIFLKAKYLKNDKIMKDITLTKLSLLTKPFDLSEAEKKDNQRSLRWLACCAMSLGFVVVFVGNIIYGIDVAFMSISASANFYGTSYLLPFVLGAMAIFFWDYIGYAQIDRVVTKTMSIAAILVALFPCNEFIELHEPLKMGFWGFPPFWSNLIHSIAAIVLFIALIYWILFLFTKTSKSRKMTKEKKRRNMCYRSGGIALTVILIFLVLKSFLPIQIFSVLVLEVILLFIVGFEILIKSGLSWFKDKN